jgi:hypothetical protein
MDQPPPELPVTYKDQMRHNPRSPALDGIPVAKAVPIPDSSSSARRRATPRGILLMDDENDDHDERGAAERGGGDDQRLRQRDRERLVALERQVNVLLRRGSPDVVVGGAGVVEAGIHHHTVHVDGVVPATASADETPSSMTEEPALSGDGRRRSANNNPPPAHPVVAGASTTPTAHSATNRPCYATVLLGTAGLLGIGAAVGICGLGHCRRSTPAVTSLSGTIAPTTTTALNNTTQTPSPMVRTTAPRSTATTPPPPPPSSIIINNATAPVSSSSSRTSSILDYINALTLTGRTLRYPFDGTAEDRALQWIINEDLNTTIIVGSDDGLLVDVVRQRYALATFAFQRPSPFLVGNNNNNNGTSNNNDNDDASSSWANPAQSECQWYGVTCDTVGRVTDVTLRGGNQNTETTSTTTWRGGGTIPIDFALLTDLNGLKMVDGGLVGTVPASLGKLPILTGLWLFTNRLTGTIPSAVVTALTNLRYLSLYSNLLTGTIPSSLGTSLTSLTELDLYNNQLTGTIPSSLWGGGRLTALTDLWLSNNQLRGTIPSSLDGAIVMTSLHLNDNRLTGSIPSSFATWTSLRRLFLYNNRLDGTMPFCRNGSVASTTTIVPFLTELVVDCDRVNCPCCTHCCPTEGWDGIPGFTLDGGALEVCQQGEA